MGDFPILHPAPGGWPGGLIESSVYQAGSPLETALFWMLVVIAVIGGVGLILYIFFVRGSYERDRRLARALIGGGDQRGYRRQDLPPEARYARGDVPDAVAEALSDLGGEGGVDDWEGGEVELVEEGEEELPDYLYPERRTARGRPAQRTYAAPAPVRDEVAFVDDEGPGETAPLLEEERPLFEDLPGEGPVWEQALHERHPAEELPIEVEPVEAPRDRPTAPTAGPQPKKDIITGPLADMLFEKELLKSAREGAASAKAKPATRPAPGRGSARQGPAWSEGKPVFSRPLETPTGIPDGADDGRRIGDALEDVSGRLRALDAEPHQRLHPEVQKQLGTQEKMFLDALQKVEAQKREEERRRDEEGRRRLEEQMRALERKKRMEEERRKTEQEQRDRERRARELREQEQMRKWDEARRATKERMLTEEERRSREERERLETRRREEARRKSQSDTIDDVLTRIGIK